jgi:hypothetical protein
VGTLLRRPLVAVMLGIALAGCVVAGRAAYGAMSAAQSQINACYKPSTGALYLAGAKAGVKKSTRAGCRAGDVAISWNVEGPAGKDGAPGKDGEPGTNGVNGKDGVSVAGTALAAGDAHCASGGAAFAAVNGVTYACNGAPGKDGVDGLSGKDGKDGKDGAPGAAGPPGPAGDFSGHFSSPNGEFALDVSDTGIKLSGPFASIELSNVGMTLKGIGLTQINAGVLQLNAVPTIIGSCGSPDHAVRAGDVALVVGPLGTPVLTPPGSNQLLVC